MSGISAISSSSIARLDHILAIPLPVPSSRASSTSDVAPPPPSSANALGAVSSEVIEVVTPAAAASSSRPSLWRRAVTLWDSYSDQEKNQAKGVAITTALWLIPGGFWKFCLGGVAAWGATEFTARVVAEKNQTANAQSQELTLAGRTKAIAIATIANGVLLRLGGIPSLIALPTSIATSYFISSHEIDPNKTPAQHLQAGQRYLETNKKKLPLQLQTALTHATPILLAATTGSLPFIAIGIGSTIAGATLPKKSEILAIEEAGLKPDPRKPLLDLASTVIQFRGSQPKNARWKGVLQPVTPPSSPQNNNPMANEIPQIPNAPGNIPREDTNYKAEADRHLKQLATYGSYWGTLYLMHTWALSLQQANPYQYTQIVREAVDNQEPLWNVFDRHIGKNLTFFQRLKAKFWYWISHSSNVSLDSAQKGLEKMSSDFRAAFTPEKQEDQAREDQLNEKVDAFLVDATNLLQEYNKATKEDAHNPVVGIDGHRRAMIQAWHGRLNELSKSFSDTIIAHWLPKHLPFFENLKNIPVFGTFLYALTSPIRWILEKISRKLIKNSIPNVIQTLITKGVEATSRRPFAIALADGLIELLTGFRDDLVKKGPKADSEIPDLPLPAIQDKLPAFVNSLIDALNLLPEKQIPQETPDQLKARVDALDKNNRPDRLQSLLSKPEKQLEQWKRNEIEKGVVKGGHMLFRYLVKNPKAVEKLFCTIARISNLPFQQNESPENDLFDSKKEGLFHIGNALFQKIVGDGVDEFLIGPPPAVVRSTLKVLFEEQQEASAQFKEIQTVAERMAEKAIDAQPQSILVDLDECAARLSEFQKKANQSKIDRVYPPIRDEIYTAFGPMYQTAHDLMEQVIQLRDTQTLLTNDQ